MSTENPNPNPDKQVVIYARVGSDTASTALDDQEATCRRFAALLGYEVVQVVREAQEPGKGGSREANADLLPGVRPQAGC